MQSVKHKKEKKIDYFKMIRGAPVFKFSDTHTIADAFRLVGYSIYAVRADEQNSRRPSVVTYMVKDTEGQPWGTVKDIRTSQLNQLLEVETPEGEIIYVPYADTIVTNIDKEKKVITINPPDGLKDLNK